MSTSSLIFSKCATAISQALSKPSDILSGCKPLSIRLRDCSSNSPANTTTPVVPSPISLS